MSQPDLRPVPHQTPAVRRVFTLIDSDAREEEDVMLPRLQSVVDDDRSAAVLALGACGAAVAAAVRRRRRRSVRAPRFGLRR